MRRYISILIISITAIGQVSGQIDRTTVYTELETKKFYSVSLLAQTDFGVRTYEVNGKKVAKSTYEKYKSTYEAAKKCCPCILESFDEHERLLSKAVSCSDCGVGWFEVYYDNGNVKLSGSYKENPTGNWDEIWKRGFCSVPNGQWIYFKDNGDILYSEYWDDGQFIKQVPEQNTIEIWDVDITYKGQNIDTLAVPIAEVGDLTITPKYKNTNTAANITIKFEITAIGYQIHKTDYTLASFKDIDVSTMLSELDIPKHKEASFSLDIYSDGELVRWFHLDIKR